MSKILDAFIKGLKHVTRRKCNVEAKKLRENLDENQVDQMVADSMDCSDPPSTY